MFVLQHVARCCNTSFILLLPEQLARLQGESSLGKLRSCRSCRSSTARSYSQSHLGTCIWACMLLPRWETRAVRLAVQGFVLSDLESRLQTLQVLHYPSDVCGL